LSNAVSESEKHMKKPSWPTRAFALVAIAASGLAIAACGGNSSTPGSLPGASGMSGSGNTILGAGASFPAPLYSKWGSDHNSVTGIRLNYQSIGSGGGISAIQSGTVDFGASDAPLTQAELDKTGLTQFPMVVGGVVLVVNVEGVADGQLRLSPDALAGIYMGTITSWDDPAIAGTNPGLALPPTRINVVHRSDGAGTTWIFTKYLSAAAGDTWTAGADKEIAWPAGVGGKGNEGVAASVQQLRGAIGYVEYAYAKQTGMATAQLQNREGAWVRPSIENFASAAANADWEGSLPSMGLVLVDQPGRETWPITGASFVLMQKEHANAARARMLLGYFHWCYTSGESAATSLDYVPLPSGVYTLVERQVWPGVTSGGAAVWQGDEPVSGQGQ
jgi:phosphate transport system substrate-binding protein